jgi:CubicO group peptidase (beta-lactamase class C family)
MRLSGLISLMLLSAFPAWCGPMEDLIATPAGKRVQAYLQAYDSHDDAQMRAFLSANISDSALAKRGIEDRIAAYHRIMQNTASIELVQVMRSDPGSLVIAVKDPQGAPVELVIAIEPNEPYKIISIAFSRSRAASVVPAGGPLTEEAVLDSISRWLAHQSASDSFSGAVLIAKAGVPLMRAGYGLSDHEHQVPNRPETKFNLGSIGKSFTRIAVEGLIAQGRLAATDKLGKFLPDYPNAEAREKVTIQQLLDMRSGIGDFFGEEFLKTPRDRVRSLQDYLPFFASKSLLFEPGTQERYSNGGFLVLGLIIEKVSGQSYYDYIRDTIFSPTGMTSSGYYASDAIVPDRAIGYTHRWQPIDQDSPELRSNVLTLPGIGSSAGGGYSTVGDLLKFVNALESGKLHSSEGSGLGIAGGAPGINAAIESGIVGKYTVIVLCNYDPPLAEDTAMALRQWMMRVKP